jgi:hypothetical protein
MIISLRNQILKDFGESGFVIENTAFPSRNAIVSLGKNSELALGDLDSCLCSPSAWPRAWAVTKQMLLTKEGNTVVSGSSWGTGDPKARSVEGISNLAHTFKVL